jgi:MFS family permease
MRLPRIFRTYSGLDRSIYFLFLAQVVNSVGHFVHPFLTLFLTRKLGMDAGEAGFFVLLSLTAWVPGSLIGGKAADTVGRKRTMTLFQALAALGLVPCAFLGASRAVAWLLVGVSFLHGIAEPVNDAMLTDLTSPGQRKAAFSLLYLGHNIGVAVGPMIAGFLFNRHLRWFFLGDALTSLAAVALVAVFVRESLPGKEEIRRSFSAGSGPEKAERGSLLAVLLRRPFLVAFLFISIPFSLVYSQSNFSLPLQMTALFGESGAATFGVLLSVNAAAVTVLTTVVLHLTGRVPPALTVSLAGVFYAAGFGLIGLVRSVPLLILSTLVWTIGEILQTTGAGAYVAGHSPMTHRGRINSVAPIIMWSGQAAGPPLAGWAIERFSLAVIWPATLALGLAGAVLMGLLHLREQGRRPLKGPRGSR